VYFVVERHQPLAFAQPFFFFHHSLTCLRFLTFLGLPPSLNICLILNPADHLGNLGFFPPPLDWRFLLGSRVPTQIHCRRLTFCRDPVPPPFSLRPPSGLYLLNSREALSYCLSKVALSGSSPPTIQSVLTEPKMSSLSISFRQLSTT